jgi:hypothetical protein
VVEAWAVPVEGDDDVGFRVNVNRTPVAAETYAWVNKGGNSRTLVLSGCSARVGVKIGRRPVCVAVNIDTPYVPLTTDGKTPDLGVVRRLIDAAASKAAKRVRRAVQEPGRPSQKDLIIAAIPAGMARMTDGTGRCSQRQLFYAVRETVKGQMPPGPDGEPFELNWKYFCDVVTDHEAESGDIPGLTRDPRGTLYHPHTREEIPLGTRTAENYERPEWTFNKILYCEKEGFIEVMKADGWPERNDCALASTKGFATRAIRDIYDALGETDEEIIFFCVHDADAYGTMIYQTLQGATRARAARKVKVINLGLEPAQALEMGLEPEDVAESDGAKAVADYVPDEWREWLQTHRVELNAMTSRQFIEWIDAVLAPYAGKVIPPAEVMTGQLAAQVKADVREAITTQVLADAGIDGLVAEQVAALAPSVEAARRTITRDVDRALKRNPHEHWSAPVKQIAGRIARGRA